LISFETSSDRPGDFGNTGAWSIIEDRDGHLWFGTYEGLFRYDPLSHRYRRYGPEPGRADGLRERTVYGVFEDRRGAIWAVTEHHIGRLDDPATGRFTSYRHTPQDASEADDLFPAVHEDAGGYFWMATNAGLVRFDPRTGRVVRFRPDPANSRSLSDDEVRAIVPDPRQPDHVLWLGTAGGGLNRFDMRTGRFTRITEHDGLPNNVVYAVLPDRRGGLWLSTNRGLARYDPRTARVRSYDVQDGLQSNEFNSGAYYRAEDGRLFFGGIHGVTAFDPEDLADNPHVPPIAITGFRRAGREDRPGEEGSPLARQMSATDTLRLSHRDDAFTFEFAALDFSAPTRNSYAYRMEGFDTGWIQAGSDRTATYTNLPPGRYTFRVRGSNNDGLWNESGAAVVVFIAPPPWRTWWAYAGYLLLLVGAGAALTRHRRNRLRLKHRLEIKNIEAEKLRELDRDRQRFFANVSHEFRTPLTLTIGPLDDLKAGLHGELSEPVGQQVDLARRNAGRVLDLINQILDVARLEAGRMPLRARELDLCGFTDAVVSSFAPAAERKGLTMTVHTEPGSVRVWADPQHLEKVLVNLLSNAIKFTPAGGSVGVTVGADAGAARIVVRDSGPGIPQADLPNVFDRFYRGDGSRQPGTGIGLALAKELVDLHGGSLTVNSEAGRGSTFVVGLPLGHRHLAPDQIAEEAAAPLPAFAPFDLASITAAGGDGVPFVPVAPAGEDVTTVLVVDDNADIRAYVRRHLESAYRVVEAADGREGVDKARALLPDLIVADVMMPELDGIGLCRELRADAETDFIPIVLLTAKAAPEDRLEGLHEHCDDYLTKPFDPPELLARVENLIEQRRRLRARYAAPVGLHPSRVDVPSSDTAFLERLRCEIESHISDEDFSVERLAAGVGVSRAHLHRRLKELLGMGPSEVIRGMRLERAADLLTARAGTVSEVAYAVGFKSVAHFSNAFQAHYGARPSVYAGGVR
jgi:signal transduction histidine kinase/DNA-binding response OmpR family regulator/streptogramin lyase